MGGLSPWHLLILAVIALLVFGGRGKISGIMGDTAKGIRAFRDGLKDDAHPSATPAAAPPQPLPPTESDKDTAAH
jgi:sec-independent protein translocase protein TatA